MASNRPVSANSPRFVSVKGVKKTSRGYANAQPLIEDADPSDPSKLTRTLNALHQRLSSLERTRPPEYQEFELDCGSSGTVTCQHDYNAPVRYVIVHWKGSAAPNLNVNESLSTTSALVLNSSVQGRAVVRVERAQQQVTSGGFGT